MNSMYGRFGMHSSLLKHHFWTTDEINEISSNWTIQNRIDYGELSLVTALLNQEKVLKTKGLNILKKELEQLRNNTNVAIAAAVTAHSRMLINSYKIYALKNNYELYYSDTDSLVLNKELPPHMVDPTILGKLKLEHHIREAIFVMPKVYYLEDINGNVISKCKGYPGKLSREQYLELLEENSLHLEVTKWSRSLKDSFVQIQRGTPYELRFSFNKRQQLFENGKWTNTKPLILDNK